MKIKAKSFTALVINILTCACKRSKNTTDSGGSAVGGLGVELALLIVPSYCLKQYNNYCPTEHIIQTIL